MKKLLSLLAPAALVAIVGVTDQAQADTPAPVVRPVSPIGTVAVNPNGPIRFFATTVKGTITVPQVQDAALKGFDCANIIVSATSKDTNPPPPGGLFAQPKWTRSVAATGNYASGQCSYSMPVPGGSAFFLNANGHGSFHCDVVATWIGPNGAQVGPITVPFGTTKVENFSISKVLCEIIK